jgi:hypothetical protein
MTAFDRAWALLKMPLYHGTNEEAWEKIQQEGLKPTDHAPQLFDMNEATIRGQYGDDYDRLFGGDWAFAYGDDAKLKRWWIGGKNAGITSADDWVMDDDNKVILEINDSHPFIREPPVIDESGGLAGKGQPYIFNGDKDQRRTNQVIPPHLIRRLSGEEIQAAYDKQGEYRQIMENNTEWMEEMLQEMLSGRLPMTDEQFANLLQMRQRYSMWGDNRLEDFR